MLAGDVRDETKDQIKSDQIEIEIEIDIEIDIDIENTMQRGASIAPSGRSYNDAINLWGSSRPPVAPTRH